MASRILITHSSLETAAHLEARLAADGYDIFRAENIEATCHLLHQRPDLLLLDMQLAENSTAEELKMLARELELAETFCLRLCPADADLDDLLRLTPFACGTICPPGKSAQIIEQVSTLLRIKQAETERNRAQESLLLHRMEAEESLRSAAQIQHALLPSRVSFGNTFSFSWQFIPCETVGGDLFNIQQLSEKTLSAYMLDVSGHGVPSAMVTVSVHQSLSDRTGQLVKQSLDQPPFYRIVDPAEVLTALDEEYPYERFEKFFTIAYLLLDQKSGRVCYSNGGHPPPLLVRNDGSTEFLTAGGTLVGMGGIVPYEQAEITLQPGDRLYLYSDGITEHTAPSGEMFGEQRLLDFFAAQHLQPLNGVTKQFISELQGFGDKRAPTDDVSLLSIQFNGHQTTG